MDYFIVTIVTQDIQSTGIYTTLRGRGNGFGIGIGLASAWHRTGYRFLRTVQNIGLGALGVNSERGITLYVLAISKQDIDAAALPIIIIDYQFKATSVSAQKFSSDCRLIIAPAL